jgi:endoglucanase
MAKKNTTPNVRPKKAKTKVVSNTNSNLALTWIRKKPIMTLVIFLIVIIGVVTLILTYAASAAGPVKGLGGKCLDNSAAKAVNGNKIQLWTCNDTVAQNWTLPGDGTMRVQGYCLDVKAGGRAAGTLVQLFACNNTGAQQWAIQQNGTISNPQSGLCLDVQAAKTADGTPIQIWPCADIAAQKWTVPVAASGDKVESTIVGLAGKCLDNDGSNNKNGNRVQIYDCNNTGAQKWSLPTDGTIRMAEKFCLDTVNASTKPSTPIQLYQCNGSASQKWQVKADRTIINPATGLCLDVMWGKPESGTGIQVWNCNGSGAQKWAVSSISPQEPVPNPTPVPVPTPTPQPTPTPVPTPTPAPVTDGPRGKALYVSPSYANAGRPAALSTQPISEWYGDWVPNPQGPVKSVVDGASAKGQLAQIVAYNIPHRDCGNYSAGGAKDGATYMTWIRNMAAGIGQREAIVILEPDALPQMYCLSVADQNERIALLSDALMVFKTQTKAYVYVDAGTSAWIGVDEMANYLNRVNLANARGFSLNVSNFQTNTNSIAYGDKVSAKVGNKPYVIDTSRNGRGPGNDWCNPPGRGLGKKSTTTTGQAKVDAFLWIKRAGESDGNCNGAPAAGQWYQSYAEMLINNAVY